jgi:hypothetical protein
MAENINTRALGFRWRAASAYACALVMSPFVIIVLVVQVLLIVHCIRTGRNTIWVWVLALLSLPGALAYLAFEVIPDLLRARATRSAMRGVRRALDPEQQLRGYAAAAERTGDVASRQRYAEELLRQGQAQRAAEVYRQALAGLYEHDPNLMLGLAQAQFAAGRASEARTTLDELIARNPDFKSPDGHLLYARALEAEGRLDQALEEYAVVAGYYAGAEAQLRYAQLLRRLGQREAARRTLAALLDHAREAPRHYRRAQERWLAAARRELDAG